jgi:hypothetical protein
LYGLPRDRGIAFVPVAAPCQAGRGGGTRSIAVPEDADVAHGEVRGTDVNVLIPYEPGANSFGELDVRVRAIASLAREITDRRPPNSIA